VTVTLDVLVSISSGGGSDGGSGSDGGDSAGDNSGSGDDDSDDGGSGHKDISEPGVNVSPDSGRDSDKSSDSGQATSRSEGVEESDEAAKSESSGDESGMDHFAYLLTNAGEMIAQPRASDFNRADNATGRIDRTLTTLWQGTSVVMNPFDALVASDFFALKRHSPVEHTETATVTPELADKIIVGSSAIVTSSLSVGYVIWILRGGSLLTAFVSAMPAWQAFDPLPILQSFEKEKQEDDESLLSLATHGSRKAAKATAGS
jgi:hypothetical protein